MDVNTEFVNRYLSKQSSIIQELMSARIQAEVKVEILDGLVKTKDEEIAGLREQITNLEARLQSSNTKSK